tara:strand:- start:8486 stop:9010 length:525 start_codon:yes stop_codon:yes gene_type:complete
MNWKLERELTEEENELLNFVHFPREVRIQNRLQKRIKKTVSIGGYINNQAPKLEDIVYNIVPKNVANYQKKKTLSPETQKAKSCLHIYFDNNEIESELNYLLATFCTPKPTPSMTVSKKPLDSSAEIEPLSDLKKMQAKKMYLEDGADLKEIAKALKLTQKILKPYLKLLDNEI